MKTVPPDVGVDHLLEVIERSVVFPELGVSDGESEAASPAAPRPRSGCICASRLRQ